MSERLTAAIEELAAAIADLALSRAAPMKEPSELLSVEEVTRRMGVGRTAVYGLISAGHLRSVRVGRRRLVAARAITDYISAREVDS